MGKNDMRSLLGITRKISYTGVINEDIVKNISPEEYNQEIDKFKKSVTPSVEFEQDPNSFKIYDGYVEWSGKLLREQLSFIFTTENSNGLYISGVNQIQLTDDTFSTIKNMMVYYKVWSSYWVTEMSRDTNNAPAQQDVTN